MFHRIAKIDWVLIGVILMLVGVSLLVLFGISLADHQQTVGNVFTRQLTFVIIGLGALLFFTFFDYRYLISYSVPFYFGMIGMLILVLLFGKTIRGTSGWIGIGSFHIQPVEAAKLVLIIFLASFISKKRSKLALTVRIIVSLIFSSILILLVLRQPDLGSGLVMAGIWLGMMFVAGMKRSHLAALLVGGVVFVATSWFFLAPYQKDRIYNFIAPEHDPKGTGYNVIQSLVAVGSGGITGKGIGKGTQLQLNFLPEKHTDFIFASLSEELGLVGSVFVLGAFGVMLFRIQRTARLASDSAGFLIASGIFVMFAVQIIVNVGMNLGIMPVTGIPLPFMSYGGSSFVTMSAAIGIVLNIHANKRLKSDEYMTSSY